MDATELPQVQYKNQRDGPTLRKLMSSGERRLDYLNDVIENSRGSAGSLNFDRAERLYHKAALKALKVQHALLREETSPLVALQDLIGELAQLGLPETDQRHDRLRRIMARARSILQELGVAPE